MNPHFPAIRRILLTLLFGISAFQVFPAEQNDEQTEALKSYYQACMDHIDSPDMLKMCDTLAMRARQVGNGHYVILAKLSQLDYYYFKNDKDKIPEYVAESKRLAREYGEKEYYYFAWGSRLVTFYLKNGMTNHALLEAQNMLREAEAEDFQKGLIECYKALGNIYSIQSNPELAVENFQEAVALAEKYAPEDINIPVYYSSILDNEIQANRFEAAEKALDKIEGYFSKSDTIAPYQRLQLARSRLRINIKKKDIAGAQQAYEQIESLFARNKGLAIYSKNLLDARMVYFKASKQYDKAISIIDSLRTTNPSNEMITVLLSRKADICWEMNDRAAAAEYYRDYLFLTDSVRRISTQQSANEIAGLLGLQQLEKEKQQLQVDMQQRRLKNTYWAISLLALALIAGTIAVIRLYRLNRQLKEAKRLVLRQNAELQRAKEQAEQASNMKSRFIQDISHEVRTPLNAIVGFSNVIGELCEQPDAKEYANIIATNSDDLLRLFNDVLELSSLDELLDTLSYNTLMDMNAICQQALEKVQPFMHKGVGLEYRTSDERLQILTNPTYVSRILNSLLHNSAKYTTSGTITLECMADRAKGVIRYSVTDTGSGIPIDKQGLVFERFHKLDTFTQGTGLGLPLSRAITEKLGGTLVIDSSYTSGCRFVLCLPLILPEE